MHPLCAVVLTLVVFAQAVSTVREQRNLSGAELIRLYNTRVINAERFVRFKDGVPAWMPNLFITTHSGVRLTLTDGSRRRYFIHKGPGFGSASYTVVTDAKYMSSAWKEMVDDTLYFRGEVMVRDLVKGGEVQYSQWRQKYAHMATNTMMNMR